MKSFQDSQGWQKAMDLNAAVDIALAEDKNWGFHDQLFRAGPSSCNNLAEGFEMPTTPHQLRYLWIVKGSCNEVCSMLLLAERRCYFPHEQIDRMLELQDETSKLIRSSIRNKSGKLGKLPGGVAFLLLWAKLATPFLAPA